MSNISYKYIKVSLESQKGNTETTNKSFWQSKIWAEILGKTKQARGIILCKTGNDEILIERRSIFRDYCGLYILGVNPDLITEAFLDSLKQEIVTSNDLFLQIEPIGSIEGRTANSEQQAPFRRFIEPVTAVLNLENKTEDELMASFAEKGRYNIRLAQKRGVTTKWVSASEACSTKYKIQSTKGDEKTYIEMFYNLLEETTERDGFSGNSLSYYKHFVETLETHDAGGLLVAEKDGILHAAGIFVYGCTSPLTPLPRGRGEGDGGVGVRFPKGTAIYYYGASSSNKEIRRDMATYLLQWDAIREAMKRGCSEYDFLGISEDGTGKLAGVTEFKLRFNPEKRHLPDEKVVIFRAVLVFLLQCVSKARKLFR